MVDLVINERRRETRVAATALSGEDMVPQVPGARVLEVLDRSAHGLRCRLGSPVRPGRPMALRITRRGSSDVFTVLVLRCEVSRLTRQGVQYEAAWLSERSWRDE